MGVVGECSSPSTQSVLCPARVLYRSISMRICGGLARLAARGLNRLVLSLSRKVKTRRRRRDEASPAWEVVLAWSLEQPWNTRNGTA